MTTTISYPELPPELWGKIFAKLNIPREPVLSVCKSWRDIALHNPRCWKHITISNSTAYIMSEQLSRAFERSGSLLIDLAVHVTSFLPETATNDYNDIAKVVAIHLHRVRSFRLSAADELHYALFLKPLIASLPSDTKYLPLTELIIRLHVEKDDFRYQGPEFCAEGELGRLLVLSTQLKALQFPAYFMVIPTIRCTLPSIKSLTLAAAGTFSVDMAPGIYSFIGQFPSLESFTYTTYHLEWSSTRPDVPESTIFTFNSLKDVVISCPSDASDIFLSGIVSTPALQSATLDGRKVLYGTAYHWNDMVQSTSIERMFIFFSNHQTLTSLEIVEMPMSTNTWGWLFQGAHGLVANTSARFEGLESLSIDEHDIDVFDDGKMGIGQTIAGLNLTSLKRLHLRSIVTMDVGAFCKFITRLGSSDFELILEDCHLLVEAISQMTLSPVITVTLIQYRRSDSFCRCWPHPLFPQRTFKTSDPFKDDSYLWDESDDDETDDEADKEEPEDEVAK